jgi:putative aldouronate transport system permease protein
MATRASGAYRAFLTTNNVLLVILAAVCAFPMINVIAVSFSNGLHVSNGDVLLWPVGFELTSYAYMLKNVEFWRSMVLAFARVALGLSFMLPLTVLTAYPLSRSPKDFPARGRYVWYFVFTMLFSGGLIPFYMVVKYLKLQGSFLALVLPMAVNVYYIVLMLNFFRQLPRELEEAAYLDGAGHLETLVRVVLPTSTAAIATVSLFIIVQHWNEWFLPILFLNDIGDYPLQAFLRRVLLTNEFRAQTIQDAQQLVRMNNKTIQAAQIVIGMIPIVAIYPAIQRHFTKGIVLGSVKG